MSLRAAAASGVKWAGASALVGNALRLLQRIVLARILVPEELGLASMLLVVVGLAEFLADFGVSSAIIQRRSSTRDELSSLYWFNWAVSAATAGLVFALREPIAGLFSEPRLEIFLPYAALAFLLAPIGQQFQALSEKEMDFRRLAFIEGTSALVQVAVSIATALQGEGVFAFVWGQLAGTGLRAVLLAAAGLPKWRPRAHFRFRDLEGYWQFGLYQVGRSAMGFASANVDYVIVGRYLGAETLGVYWLAYQLVVWPVMRTAPIFTRVSFPAFARIQHDEDSLRAAYVAVTRAMAFLMFPALFGIAATAPLLVPVVFGVGWDGAIGLARILVPLAMVRALGQPVVVLLLAKGRADYSFWSSTVAAVVCTLVFVLVVDHGVDAIAWSYVGLSVLFLGGRTWLVERVARVGLASYLRALLPATLSSASLAAFVWVLNRFALSGLSDGPWKLALLCGLGALWYAGLSLLFQRDYVTSLAAFLRHRGGPESAPERA